MDQPQKLLIFCIVILIYSNFEIQGRASSSFHSLVRLYYPTVLHIQYLKGVLCPSAIPLQTKGGCFQINSGNTMLVILTLHCQRNRINKKEKIVYPTFGSLQEHALHCYLMICQERRSEHNISSLLQYQ